MGSQFLSSTHNLEAILQVYSLSEILEINEVTEEEALAVLIETKTLSLPIIKPLE